MKGLLGRAQRYRLLHGNLAAAALAAASPVFAEPAPPFPELLKQTINAPRRAVFDAEVDRARGLSAQARTRPNPNLSLTTENILGQSPYGGLNRAETTLQVNQPLELGGKRSARMAAGDAGVRAAAARATEGKLNYAYELAKAYGTAETAERRISLAEDDVEEAQEDLRAARALVAAGKEARLRSLQAQSEVTALQAELDSARANRIAALSQLSAIAGVAEPYTGISAPLLGRRERVIETTVDPRRTASVLVAEAERELALRRVAVERKRAIPDVTASLGVRRLEIEKTHAVVAGVSLPLGLFDRNRGNIAAAQAELRAAEARVAAAQLEAEGEIRTATGQVDAANARAAAAEASLRIAQETYRLARIGYESGKSPLIELIAARRGVGQARGVVLDAEKAQFEARAALARLQGRTVTGEPVQ